MPSTNQFTPRFNAQQSGVPSKEEAVSNTAQATESTEEIIKIKKKLSDLVSLYKIHQLIKKVLKNKDKEENIKDLIAIGELCGGQFISYNDKDKDCIRNNFGDIKRHDGNAKRVDGIPFEHLYRLHKILKVNSKLTDVEHEDLKEELLVLKDKVEFVLSTEVEKVKLLEDERIKEAALALTKVAISDKRARKLEKLHRFIETRYPSIIIKKMLDTIQIQEADCSFEHRENRYHLARMLVIVGELAKELPDRGVTASLKEALKSIAVIRDALTHQHEKLIVVCETDKAKAISGAAKAFFETFVKTLTDENFKKTDECEALGRTADALHQSIIGKHMDANASKNKKEQSLATAVAIKKAKKKTPLDEIKRLVISASIFYEQGNTPKELTKNNQRYVTLLSQLSQNESAQFPPSLEAEHKEAIMKIAKEAKANAKQLNTVQQNESQEKSQKKKAFLVTNVFKQIDDEMAYCATLDQTPISAQKKAYIIQHIVSVIGQYIRDMREHDPNKEISELASGTFEKMRDSSISVRNNGLSHDVLSFDVENFERITIVDILPAHEDAKALHAVWAEKNKQLPDSLIIANNVAVSYVRLGYYVEAINRFNSLLEAIEKLPQKVQKEKMENSGVTQNFGLFIDLDRYIFGIDSYEFMIIKNIITTNILIKNYAQVIKIATQLLNKINFSSLSEASDAFVDDVAFVMLKLAASYFYQEQYENCYECCQDIEKIARSVAAKAELANQLSEYFFINKQYAQAAALNKDLLNSDDPNMHFNALIRKAKLLTRKGDAKKASAFIQQAEAFLNEKMGVLKRTCGDQVESLKLQIFNAKAFVLSISQNNDFDDIQALEQAAKNLFNASKRHLNSKSKGYFHAYLATAYAANINPNTVLDSNDKRLVEHLEENYKAAKKSVEVDNPILREASTNLATAYKKLAHKPGIEQKVSHDYLKQAFDIEQTHKMQSDHTVLQLGISYFNLGMTEHTREYFPKAIEYLKTLEENNVLSAQDELLRLMTLAQSYQQVGYCCADAVGCQKAGGNAILFAERALVRTDLTPQQAKIMSVCRRDGESMRETAKAFLRQRP